MNAFQDESPYGTETTDQNLAGGSAESNLIVSYAGLHKFIRGHETFKISKTSRCGLEIKSSDT